ncbi:uncharacterized protein LOC132304698 [Cornus florida]|uniref:uncharacterized protein LOC132304698 n=1 Tax=Cornus florida TaxID=4283 RepID=UPI00289703F2|nr:uncharacterized protein LOC132304698 [Cornus florida]
MSNLTKLKFVALDIFGKNYLSWILDAQIHLDAMGPGDTIKENNEASLQDKANAIIFLRRHISEELKTEYLTERDPLCLWNNLKEGYDHQKTVILPKARADWLQLMLQDFKIVAEYKSILFKISSTLKLCGDTVTDELLLEKIFTTFHASNVLLQQQYREHRFKKYLELISCLLVAEQNNELLLRNHQSRLTGLTLIPETYVASSHGRGCGRGRGCGGKNGHNNEYGRGKNNYRNNDYGRGHWQSICRTSKHLADLYQASMKEKGKQKEMNFLDHDEPVDTTNMEMNFINHDEPVNITNLDVSDFFDDHDERIDFLIDDGNVNTS